MGGRNVQAPVASAPRTPIRFPTHAVLANGHIVQDNVYVPCKDHPRTGHGTVQIYGGSSAVIGRLKEEILAFLPRNGFQEEHELGHRSVVGDWYITTRIFSRGLRLLFLSTSRCIPDTDVSTLGFLVSGANATATAADLFPPLARVAQEQE